MTRFITFFFALFITFQGLAQIADLDQYSYVIVPNQFGFQSEPDQYQLNSMTKFYLDKNGFNAFLASDSPHVDRCDGLYADVENLKTIFGTKLQIVLKDCNKKEMYRGPEAKSKFKEYEKSYQDALRKAFDGMDRLRVKQKDVIVLEERPSFSAQKGTKKFVNQEDRDEPEIANLNTHKGLNLPSENYSNYSANGKSFFLRKTGEGFSLYQESATAGDDLVLVGKIIILDKLVKFMDSSGQVNDAVFDDAGTLTIGTDTSSIVYKKVKN